MPAVDLTDKIDCIVYTVYNIERRERNGKEWIGIFAENHSTFYILHDTHFFATLFALTSKFLQLAWRFSPLFHPLFLTTNLSFELRAEYARSFNVDVI